MREKLEAAWKARAADVPLASPYEALILASIVEKETALPAERPRIAGVFTTRLRQGMRLQTDPTVIYGLGARFDGNLRRSDLERDGPYNTYTRVGLPPTPMQCPGRARSKPQSDPTSAARCTSSRPVSRTAATRFRDAERARSGGRRHLARLRQRRAEN
jgi:UPF0755 protein